MHLDPVSIFFFLWGLSTIVFRRAAARRYVLWREMTKGFGTGSTTQRRGEIIAIVSGVVLIGIGIIALFLPP